MTPVFVSLYDEDTLEVRFHYDQRIVDMMRTVPRAYWNPHARAWLVPTAYGCFLESVLNGCPVRWEPGTGPYAQTPPTPAEPDGRWAEALFAAVGPAWADAVFRALTRVLHPDVGGDADLMRDLLDARDHMKGTAA